MALEELKSKYSDITQKQSTIFGRIYTARCMSTDQLVAIKEDTRPKPSAEPQIHAQLGNHEHIVQYLDSFVEKRRSFIVMEYCRFGTLKELIEEQGTLPLRSVQHLFKQVVSGLEHIHSRKFLYRNLEPYHVLINEIDDNGDMFVKLCDFGATRPLQNEKQGLLQASVDFKSLGSLMFFMITGNTFLNTPEVYERISNFSETSANLIKRLLECDSSFGFNDIKSHPFYTFKFHGDESFCKEELSVLYESLRIETEEDFEHEDKENLSNSPVLLDHAFQKEELIEKPASLRREEVSPVPPMNNVTVDSAYTSAYSPAINSPQVEQQRETNRNPRQNVSLFACFVAVFRALCGYK